MRNKRVNYELTSNVRCCGHGKFHAWRGIPGLSVELNFYGYELSLLDHSNNGMMDWKGLLRSALIFFFVFYGAIVESVKLEEGSPVVETPSGRIRGTVALSRHDRSYFSFNGIRYATSSRFELATEVDRWEGTLNAIDFGPPCAQINMLTRDMVSTEEDCLFLNIYVPAEPQNETHLSVMLWIHGGSFTDGAGSEWGPDYFMNQDVILITVNYRLGILGFSNTEDGIVPANNGLKDVIIALKWVQKNIKSFGGDPSRVTLFGASSGAAMVHFLVLSSAAKGLFSNAILQSGNALCPWAVMSTPATHVRDFAMHLNCPFESSQKMMKCLRKKPIESLLEAQIHFAETKQVLFGPSVESELMESSSDYAIIPTIPYESIAHDKGNSTGVSLLIGYNAREAIFSAVSYFLSSSTTMAQLRNNWNSLIGQIFHFHDFAQPKEIATIARKLRKIYFGDKDVSLETSDNLINMATDVFFARGTRLSVELHAHYGASVFPYIFSYSGGYSLSRLLGLHLKGPGHADDVQFLFPSIRDPKLYPDLEIGSEEQDFSRRMVELWVAFAANSLSIYNRQAAVWFDEPVRLSRLEDTNYPFLYLDMETKLDQMDPERYQKLIEVDKLLSEYEKPRKSWRATSGRKDEL